MKYIKETIDVIPLFPLVGVNHNQPLIQMSKIMVHLYSTDEKLNQFAIGFMINYLLHINKVLGKRV